MDKRRYYQRVRRGWLTETSENLRKLAQTENEIVVPTVVFEDEPDKEYRMVGCPKGCYPYDIVGGEGAILGYCKTCPHCIPVEESQMKQPEQPQQVQQDNIPVFLPPSFVYDGAWHYIFRDCPARCQPIKLKPDGTRVSTCRSCGHCIPVSAADPRLKEIPPSQSKSTRAMYTFTACPEHCHPIYYDEKNGRYVSACNDCPHCMVNTDADLEPPAQSGDMTVEEWTRINPQTCLHDGDLKQHHKDATGKHWVYRCRKCGATIGYDEAEEKFRVWTQADIEADIERRVKDAAENLIKKETPPEEDKSSTRGEVVRDVMAILGGFVFFIILTNLLSNDPVGQIANVLFNAGVSLTETLSNLYEYLVAAVIGYSVTLAIFVLFIKGEAKESSLLKTVISIICSVIAWSIMF